MALLSLACSKVEVFFTGVSSSYMPAMCRALTDPEVQPSTAWTVDFSGSELNQFSQVMSSPSVGDLDLDKVPEVVFTSFRSSSYNSAGVLRIISGKTGIIKKEIYEITGAFATADSTDVIRPHGAAQPLLIDIDRNGFGEIVIPAFRINLGEQTDPEHYLLALNHDGSFRWAVASSSSDFSRLGASAGDLFQDGKTQIIYGSMIITEQKEGVDFRAAATSRLTSNNKTEVARHSFAVSLSTEIRSALDIVTHSGVYDRSGVLKFKFCYDGQIQQAGLKKGHCVNAAKAVDGYIEVGDLRAEIPGNEIVLTGNGRLLIFNGLTGEVIGPDEEFRILAEHKDTTKCSSGRIGGGQATLGDFSGAGDPQIAIATGRSLTIFDKMGRVVAGSTTEDCSSLSTGITSFDFNGDGRPEIVYGDEQYLRIYEMDGTPELKVIWQTPNPTGTLQEYPIVADVDLDGSADLLMPANNYACPAVLDEGGNVTGASGVCGSMPKEDQVIATQITGLRLFKPATDRVWMPTRPIWNQGSYFVANVGYDLKGAFTDNLVASPSTSFSRELLSIFKRNVQGDRSISCEKKEGAFKAPSEF